MKLANTNQTKIKKTDFILLAVFLGIGLLLLCFLLLTKKTGNQVEVRVDGEITETYALSESGTWIIEGHNGGTNKLVISDGQAWVEEASCPDGLCVNMGKISSVGQSIVCLPNRVVVEVVNQDGTRESSDGVDVTVK